MLYREAGDFKTSYRDDSQTFPLRLDRMGYYAILAVAFLVIPFVITDYWANSVLVPFLIYAIAALGLNILVGYGGQVSLGTGGFMAVGTPERLIDEIVRQNRRNLTVIANDTALPGRGIGKLISAKLVRKAIVSHIGLNPETQKQMMAGEIEVELVPQGTLIERIRAGGYGLGGANTRQPGSRPARPPVTDCRSQD